VTLKFSSGCHSNEVVGETRGHGSKVKGEQGLWSWGGLEENQPQVPQERILLHRYLLIDFFTFF
jgi:hypothetical protein